MQNTIHYISLLLYCGGETVEGPKKKTQDDENVPVDNGGGGGAAAFTSCRFLAVQSNSLLSLNTIPTPHTHSFFSTFHLLASLQFPLNVY